ncbi:MAG: hypothetical protein KDD37_05795 [Bdellovibrionales bacterium]|nr:hypothetical protein [Bdellovibrionales bacterium]
MDITEEFEFKPITEGLGFHKKQVSLKEETKKAQEHVIKTSKPVLESEDLHKVRQPAQAQSVRDLISSFPALDGLDYVEEENKQQVQMKEALPRKDLTSSQLHTQQVLKHKDPELKINPEVFQRKLDMLDVQPLIPEIKKQEVVEDKKLSEKKRVIDLVAKAPTIGTYLIDAFTIIGLTNVFMAALLLVTGVDVVFILMHPQSDILTKISVGVVLFSVWMFYLLISRTFFSKTLGEWATDYQLGTDMQTLQMSYPLRVAMRAFVNTITGIVILPLLSVLTGKDIVGSLCGIKLHKKVETWQ